jgi:hypothetical protein
MAQWEYRVERVSHGDKDKTGWILTTVSLQTALNLLGQEGWELVTVWNDPIGVATHGNAVLKRRKEAALS